VSPAQLRAHLLDPAKDGNPAVLAARRELEKLDRVRAAIRRLLEKQAGHMAAAQELDELRRAMPALHREIDRLRAELTAKTKAPWEE